MRTVLLAPLISALAPVAAIAQPAAERYVGPSALHSALFPASRARETVARGMSEMTP